MSLYLQEDAGVDVLLIVNTALCCWLARVNKPPAVDVLLNPVIICGETLLYVAQYRQRQPYGMLPATEQWEGPKCQQHVMK